MRIFFSSAELSMGIDRWKTTLVEESNDKKGPEMGSMEKPRFLRHHATETRRRSPTHRGIKQTGAARRFARRGVKESGVARRRARSPARKEANRPRRTDRDKRFLFERFYLYN
jgi:hypothetical protein